jgi:arabinofuranan 3-O-arabinosyltransferase
VLYAGPEETLSRAVIVSPGSPGFVSEQKDQRLVVQSGARVERLVRYEEDRIRNLKVKRQARTLRLRLADPFRLTIGGRTLRGFPSESISVRIARDTPALVTAGSTVFRLRRGPARWESLGLLGLRPGEAVTVWQRGDARSVDLASRGPVRDCNAFDDREAEDVGLRASVNTRAGRRTLRLSARAHSACVNFPLMQGRSSDVLRVRFRYRQLRGNPARACLWQPGVDRCAAVPDLRASRTWQTFDASIRPHARATGLTLFLYADGGGRGPATATEYQSIRVERYRRAAEVPRTTARVSTLKGNAATESTLAYSPPPLPAPIDLDQAGPVGDCHSYDARTPRQLGLAARVSGRSDNRVLQLAASAHSACVDFAISSDAPLARMYRVQFEYRRLSGSSPRVCLWQDGPERCASLSRLHSDREWRVFDETVPLEDDVQAVRFFLYADGGGDGPTVTEYRNVHVGPVASASLVGIPKDRPLPQIVVRREAPWKFHVQVEKARAPFLLATSEAFASGWKARAEGHDDSALRHVEVNGYANGWLVPFKGSYDMTLEYGPERWARAARWLSAIAILGVFGLIGLRRLRAFDVRWHAR